MRLTGASLLRLVVVAAACFLLSELIVYGFSKRRKGSDVCDEFEMASQGDDAFELHRRLLANYKKLNPNVDENIFGAFEYVDHIVVTLATTRYVVGTSLYCVYFNEKSKQIGRPVRSFMFPLFVVRCPKRSGAARISITASSDAIYANTASLSNRLDSPKHFLAFCLAPIYGNETKWLHLVEVLEHYRLQGVTYSFIYVRDIDKYSMSLLLEYMYKGVVELVWIPPKMFHNVVAQQKFAVADCLQRSKDFARWVIFADLDERLLMVDESQTVESYLRADVQNSSIGSVNFAQRWVMKTAPIPATFTNRTQVLMEMPSLRYSNTSAAARQDRVECAEHSCWGKVVVDPRRVVWIDVHHVIFHLPGFSEYLLPPTVGYIRHYRDVRMDNWGVQNAKILQNFGAFEETFYPRSLANKLKNNVVKQLIATYGEK